MPAWISAQLANDDWVLTQTALDNLNNNTELKSAFVAYSVAEVGNLDDGFVSSFSKKLMRPASSLKVLTAWQAYKLLGPEYTFRTKLSYSGKISDGVLNGNIVIQGSGDPTLGSNFNPETKNLDQLLKSWVEHIVSAGIKKINGDVIVVQAKSKLESIPETWTWDDIGNYYGTGSYELNINENAYTLSLNRKGREGQVINSYSVNPRSPFLKFDNLEVIEGPRGSGDQAYIYGSPFSYERNVRGSVPTGSGFFNIKGALPSPGMHLGFWLKEELTLRGISCNSYRTEPVYRNNLIILDEVISPPLKNIIKTLLHKSNNLYTESLLSVIREDRSKGIEQLEEYCESIGIKDTEYAIYDGSGLSSRNMITPESFVVLLSHIAEDSEGKAFMELLPQFGKDGTLRNMMRGKEAATSMRGKSGSIGSVLTYIGYFEKEGNKRYAFAIMVDHWNGENYKTVKSGIENLLESTFNDLY